MASEAQTLIEDGPITAEKITAEKLAAGTIPENYTLIDPTSYRLGYRLRAGVVTASPRQEAE